MSLAQSEFEDGEDGPTRATGRFELLICEGEPTAAPEMSKTYKPAPNGAKTLDQGPSMPELEMVD